MAHNITYRADIDGLRAVAVLSVVLFHIDFDWVPGGYTGVDIFFVISGFLITQIIGREIEEGRFSVPAFYVRRIRRILPVFYTVTAVTMLAGFVLLLPEDFIGLAVSMCYAILFMANIYFSKEQGYFAISSDEKPLLHTWSLSIEEQYYFIWPLLLLLFYVLGQITFKQPKKLHQKTAITLTLGLVVAGFAFTQHALASSDATPALYMMLQTRFAELMEGSFVALLPIGIHQRLNAGLSYLGAALIAVGLFALNKDSVFPGYNALLPCLGAACVIYAGRNADHPRPRLNKALSLPFVVWVGLISYSLYLWHWPVLAYMRYIYGQYELPISWIVLAVVMTTILATLSYRYVEQRTKNLRLSFPKAFLGLFMLPAALLVGTTYLAKYRSTDTYPAELISYGQDVCHGNFDQHCVRGAVGLAPTVLVTGDSHAASLNSFIDVVGRHEGWSANVFSAGSCSPVFGLDETVLAGWAHEPCNALKRYVHDNYQRYDAVVLASQWAFQLGMEDAKSDPAYLEKLEQTLREIARSIPVYVVSDVPSLAVSPFRTLRFAPVGRIMDRPAPTDYLQANKVIKDLVLSIPNVHYVDLSNAYAKFSPQGMYRGKAAYFDGHHLNIYGSTALGHLFVDAGQHIVRAENGGTQPSQLATAHQLSTP